MQDLKAAAGPQDVAERAADAVRLLFAGEPITRARVGNYLDITTERAGQVLMEAYRRGLVKPSCKRHRGWFPVEGRGG